ncbi:hypothetical protein BOTBODRAFT_50913 [Botryobasidium botryosum FD-172 SS1]|uniref:Uncharacterized protein n=1 Tax=Botryobasidium botryosum (strain FD-172 SS1) TaxID=930990 RepID=A0A067NAT8_BOTB1|nr:hypothetical protein BOTBODRAFT_50913 [Botryobasidium botryosum FD-172 SS1]
MPEVSCHPPRYDHGARTNTLSDRRCSTTSKATISSSCIPQTITTSITACPSGCPRPTVTSTTTLIYPTQTIYPPCPTRPPPPPTATPSSGLAERGEEPREALEARWTCAPGSTVTAIMTLPCQGCQSYPTTVVTTVTVRPTAIATCPGFR